MLAMRVKTVALGLAVLACPAISAPQDAAAILDAVRQASGGAPRTLRIMAAGSGYAASAAELSSRQYFRIESYTQDLDLGAPSLTERIVRLDGPAAAGKGARQTETRTARPGSRWTDQYLLWISPYGFLAGAASRPATVAPEALFGTTYRVVTFSAGGPSVQGYVTDKNVLERTRTTFDDPVLGTVRFEAVYLNWTDFGGVRYPGVVIHKENDQLARILIVEKVESGAPAAPGAP
jgi:hypothetical protein